MPLVPKTIYEQTKKNGRPISRTIKAIIVCDVDGNGNPIPLPESTDFEGLWVIQVNITVLKNGHMTYTIPEGSVVRTMAFIS